MSETTQNATATETKTTKGKLFLMNERDPSWCPWCLGASSVLGVRLFALRRPVPILCRT